MFALDGIGEEEQDAVDLSDFRVIGPGRSSVVYLAESATHGGRVAVKVFEPSAGTSRAWTRFERDSRIVGGLSDRLGIVAIHEIGTGPDGRRYVVMPYLEGGPLSALLTERGPLSATQIVGLGESLAGTLAVAHGLGVMHRDLKPSNLLVSGGGAVLIGDFGTAALRPRPRARTTPPPHLAPEVVRGEEPSERSDVYALASTLYELVQGHPPFRRTGKETVAALIGRRLTEPPPAPTAVPDGALVAVLMAALDPDPTVRPTAADFQMQLGEFDLEPVFDARRPVTRAPLGPLVADPLLGPGEAEPVPEPVAAAVLAEPEPEPELVASLATPVARPAPVAPVFERSEDDPDQVPGPTPLARPEAHDRGRTAAWIGAAAALLALFVGAAAWRDSRSSDRAAGPPTTVADPTGAAVGPPAVAEAATVPSTSSGPALVATTTTVPPTTVATSTVATSTVVASTVAASTPTTVAGPTTTTRSTTTTTRPSTTTTRPTSTTAPPGTSATVAPTTTVRTAPPPTAAATTPAPTTAVATTVATPAPTTIPPTVPPTAAPTSPPPPPTPAPAPKPTVGSLSVTTSSNGVRVTANNGDRCANSRWVLSGPVSKEQASTAPAGCFPNPHGFDSTWYQLTLTPGSYTITLTLTNGAGSNSSSTNFTIG